MSTEFEEVKSLAKEWCGRGASVRYMPVGLPALPGDRDRLALHHIEGHVLSMLPATAWMSDRLSGQANSANCGLVPFLP